MIDDETGSRESMALAIQRAGFGIAGPVVNRHVETPNLPWKVTIQALSDRLGIPGDRAVYVIDGRDETVSARTRPKLLAHKATTAADGEIVIDGHPWESPDAARIVREAAGPDARLIAATDSERFDILPLLVATDGAIAAFGHDLRRLRPNVVIGGVSGLSERHWEWTRLRTGDAVIALADLRGRCIMTTWDPDTNEQDVSVLRDINARFGGTFALNAWAGQPGLVRVGDPVEIIDQQIKVGDIFEVFYSNRRNWETIQPSGFVLAKLDTGEVIIPGLDIVFEIIQEWDPDKIRYEELFGEGIIKPV